MKFIFSLAMVTISLAAQSQSFYSRHFDVNRLADGIYAMVAKPGGYAICNAGVIDLGREVLVFDDFMTPQAAADLARFISSIIKKPVRYVVNSHYHNDHIRGNQVFSGAIIIGTPITKQLIETREPLEIADEKTYAPAQEKFYDSIGISANAWQASEDKLWKG